jgi:hypothetical protein
MLENYKETESAPEKNLEENKIKKLSTVGSLLAGAAAFIGVGAATQQAEARPHRETPIKNVERVAVPAITHEDADHRQEMKEAYANFCNDLSEANGFAGFLVDGPGGGSFHDFTIHFPDGKIFKPQEQDGIQILKKNTEYREKMASVIKSGKPAEEILKEIETLKHERFEAIIQMTK